MGNRVEQVISEDLVFESEGQLLQGTYFYTEGESALSAVILCHGSFEGRKNWVGYARRLAEQGFPSLVFDFVGHGDSSGRRGLVDMHQWAYNLRDASNSLSRRGVRHFALVGWDSGGSAALLAAAHDRRVVCTAVLAAPVQIIPPLHERTAYILATGASRVFRVIKKKPLTFSRERSLEALPFAVEAQADAAYKANLRQYETWRAVPVPDSLHSVWVDITRAVEKIKSPVLILHGAQDKVVPLKQSETLHKLLNGTKKLVVIEESGHALHFDQKKDEVYVDLARWIKHYLNE